MSWNGIIVIQAGQRINEIERIQTDEVARIQSEYVLERDKLNTLCQQKLDEIQENIDAVTQEKTELRLQEQKIRQFNPFQKLFRKKRTTCWPRLADWRQNDMT